MSNFDFCMLALSSFGSGSERSKLQRQTTKALIKHFWVHQLSAAVLLELLSNVPDCKVIQKADV